MQTAQEQLAEAKAELELETVKRQLDAVRNEKSMVEAATEINLFRNDYLYDDHRLAPHRGSVHVSQLRDMQRGRNWPVYEVEDDLNAIRGDARLLANENEVAIGANNTLGNFTLGTGLKYRVSLKKKTAPRGNIRLVNAVQDWIDEFIDRTEWTAPERELHNRSIVDGEPFVELINLGGGRSEPIFHEPDAIAEPKDARSADDYLGEYALDWLFGIGTYPGRPSKPVAYHIDLSGDQTDWDIVPADRMVHCKRNVVENCKRGVSDYYACSASLRRVDKILRNVGDGGALQSAIAWIREHPPGTTGSQVLALGSGKTEIDFSRPTLGGTSRDVRAQTYLPGTILDVRNGQTYKPGPLGNGSTFVDVAGAITRFAGLRWNIPEFMISGDTGSTNFAAILVAESPFVKAMESEQTYFARVYRRLFWKMLGIAIRANRFSSYGIYSTRQLKERLKIEVLMPRVSVRNRLEETKIRSVLYEYGLLSGPTWAVKEELDYEHEQEQRAENVPLVYEDPEASNDTESTSEGQDQRSQKRGDTRASARLRKIGLGIGISDREYQPQANEPGNVGSKEGT